MRKFLAILLALVFVAAACGGDDDTASSDDGSDTSTASDDGSTTSDDGSTTSDGAGGSFCDMARTLDESAAFDFTSLTSGELFDQAEAAIRQAVAVAPSEIKADLSTLADGFTQLKDLLEKYDYNLFDPDLAAEMESFDTAELDAAGARVDAYMQDACGIDVGSTDTSGTTDDSSTMPDTSGLDPSMFEGLADNPAALASVFASMGIDAELASCLVQELSTMDEPTVDQDFLNQEICGTTWMEIMTTLGGQAGN